ncbi:MAG TPA: thiamine-phosphate kinase [Acidobacteriaceae bacterium]|nr:thiamine-phosphate kinase [Acidobacteriaceae bacterium]
MASATTKKSVSAGELAILETIRSRAGARGRGVVRLGIGDDCALLAPAASDELAVTTDLSIEGRHFRLEWHPAESVGHRTLARGLSDLASMGAEPAAAFLSLGLPRRLTRRSGARSSWIDRFLDGFLALAKKHRVPLAGGDLSESPIAMADIVLIGTVPRREALLRSGAKAGDALYITGSLGGSAAELVALSRSPRRFAGLHSAIAEAPHLYPQPRLKQGLWLRKHGATAAIDLSDGISTDLHHLCEESRVAAIVDAALIPRGPGASLEQALHGGEDYELLFTAPEAFRLPKRVAGVALTRIGTIAPYRASSPRVMLRTGDVRQPLTPHGWEHFSAAKSSRQKS